MQHNAPQFWYVIVSIPNKELWAVREALRSYLVAFILERIRELWTARDRRSGGRVGHAPGPSGAHHWLARRFTDYKRPELIFYKP
jgi:glucan phosphorylase